MSAMSGYPVGTRVRIIKGFREGFEFVIFDNAWVAPCVYFTGMRTLGFRILVHSIPILDEYNKWRVCPVEWLEPIDDLFDKDEELERIKRDEGKSNAKVEPRRVPVRELHGSRFREQNS